MYLNPNFRKLSPILYRKIFLVPDSAKTVRSLVAKLYTLFSIYLVALE